MEHPAMAKLCVGDWCVNPAAGEISRNGESVRVEARTMRLLTCLAEHAGEVVSIDELLDDVWSGVTVSSDSVYQAVTTLRRMLGDDPKQPRYIATVPRLGYRMVAAVSPWDGSPTGESVLTGGSVLRGESGLAGEFDPRKEELVSQEVQTSSTSARIAAKPGMPRKVWWMIGIGAAVVVALAAALSLHGTFANIRQQSAAAESVAQPQKSIAVLPFLDLTAGMKEEEFADGMTEELIDKLSKIPDLRVPAPTSSFYFKGKQVPVAEIARTLGVVYVVDGSVRKSGSMIRVAARLVRADNGYVIWSETYDRPFNDRLMVQDDIAGEVTKALRASPEFKPQ
jgi:TolB-like protein/DNA-binding winged helix-turn-helix (wHTH) protein